MVIDELIVVLGFDTRKFTEGQREALDAYKKGKEGAVEFGKEVEAQGMKMSEVFGIARKGALGILGAFVGGEAVAFIDHVIGMDAATGRMAKTINTSVENLGVWQGMIREVGGSAEDATTSLSAMQNEINNFKQGGGMFSEGFGFLLNKIGGVQGKNADQIMRELQTYFAGQISSGAMRPDEAATYLRRVPGMNQNMINLLLGDFKKTEDAARAVGGATKETADAAEKLQGKFSLLIQATERFGASLIPVIELLMKPVKDITKDDINKVAPGMNDLFIRDSMMDRLDRWIWGDHNMEDAKKRLADGLNAQAGTGGTAVAGGGTRGDRNNNPGNIEDGAFARAHGATGTDGRFAIFPDKASGESAMAALLVKNYQGLNLAQIQRKWVGNSDPNYLGSMSSATGIGAGDVPNLNDPAVVDKLMAGMARGEGSHIGARGAAAARVNNNRSNTSTTTSTTTIGKIDVHTNATDADGIARDIGPSIKHSAITAPANSGLL